MILDYSKKQFFMIAILSLLSYGLYGQTNYYVSPSGSNSNSGLSTSDAWSTIQYAVDQASAGDEIQVLAGTYNELVEFQNSGNSTQGNIVLKNYGTDTPIIDGTGLESSPGFEIAIIKIENQDFIEVSGFELRNLTTSNNKFPAGIWVLGDAHDININNNKIHSIEQSAVGGAHGLAVYGRNFTNPIYNISITENEIYDCVLAWSEALVLNGNVKDFEVNYNIVHDNNNIGIDFIGHEGECPNPDLDQARDGVCRGNLVYNIDSRSNPVYEGEASADGIYVDGGKNILIEQNEVYSANIGIEVASEWPGKLTSEITVRNNFVYNCHVVGFAMGGYDAERGETKDCKIINNTFYNNQTDLDWGAEMLIQYYCHDNVIKNNIFYAKNNGVLMANWNSTGSNNDLDYNLYYTTGSPEFSYNGTYYGSLSAYQSGTGQGSNSSFDDPEFNSTFTPDLHLSSATSPAVNNGDNSADVGSTDFDGQSRIQNGTVDIGADEFGSGPSCTIGDPCDDEDPCTTGTTYDANCNCTNGTDTCNDCELLSNPNFDSNLNSWEYWQSEVTSVTGIANITDIQPLPNYYDVALVQSNVVVEQGETYEVTFLARADGDRQLEVEINLDADPYTTYHYEAASLNSNWQVYTMNFTMTNPTDNNAKFGFYLGGSTIDTYIDNVSLQKINCGGSCPDTDGDSVCDAEDVCPNFDDTLIGTPCDDELDCTTDDVYTTDCECAGTAQDTDGDGVCDAEDVCPNFDDTLIGTPCDDGVACTTSDVYTTDCECVGTAQDTDGDGVCDADDVCPNFDDTLIGTPCDDGVACTTSDVYTTDCECAGTFADADQDGICDADDDCPNDATNTCNDISYCDAQSTNTTYEFIQSVELNGQTNNSGNDGGYGDYTGTTLVALDNTNSITLTPGFANSTYAENWAVWIDFNKDGDFDDAGEEVFSGATANATPLSGTFSAPSGTGTTTMRVVMEYNQTPDPCGSFTYGEVEDYTIQLATDCTPNTPCDDGDACTSNDTYNANCECVGTEQDADGDGVCDNDDVCPNFDDTLIGTPCDDGIDCTTGDVYTTDCECAGTFADSDDDGVCDADDVCPNFDNTLIGTPCDDGSGCTTNDVYTSDCECAGTAQDTDGDGVCDDDDVCPNFDDTLIGTPCDDGVACTTGDVYTTDCECAGTFADADQDGICDADDDCPNDATNTCNDISYCDAQGTNTTYEFIQSVEIGGVINESGDNGGYAAFPNITFPAADVPTPITLTPGFANSAYNENWSVWIDANKDGDFDDSNELVFSGTSVGNTPLTGQVTMPSVSGGVTTLRVVMEYNQTPESCGSFTYGEVEDYLVSVGIGGKLATESQLIQVYPNPADSYVNVDLHDIIYNSNVQSVQTMIYTIDGKQVHIEELDVTSILTINTRHLPEASYILRLRTDDGRTFTGRFVKL